ncbi:LysR family transcriptional regulator [Streptomyces sp. UP1A-1]|nr:LysR family transcriptional regulator [Streptomyces sp. UP1A-1]
MDLLAVRTFVTAAEAGQLQIAADLLAVTQQAVSKRVAALEKSLGVSLFTRTARGVRLTAEGQAFLPHARALLDAEERAVASVRPGRRPLRVDVIGRRAATAGVLRDFHRARPGVGLDVVTLTDVRAAVGALLSGAVDASFRCVTMPGFELPHGIRTTPLFEEPLHLVTGPAHPLATAAEITPALLAVPAGLDAGERAGHRVDRLLRRPRRRVRAHPRHQGTELRRRGHARHHRRVLDGRDLPQRPDTARPARRPRAAAHPAAGSDARLPALPALARRQSAPRARGATRPSRVAAAGPPGGGGLGAPVGAAGPPATRAHPAPPDRDSARLGGFEGWSRAGAGLIL